MCTKVTAVCDPQMGKKEREDAKKEVYCHTIIYNVWHKFVYIAKAK